MLQRGRAPESAECPKPAPREAGPFPLQRGRAPESAEWRRKQATRFPRPLASTGPRSGERGVNAAAEICKRNEVGFNGAALRRARSAP